MGGRTEFDFSFGAKGQRPRRPDDGQSPFRLLLVGDFSGRAAGRARGDRKALRRPLMVDAGDIDRAVATLAPTLRLWAPDAGEEVATFASVDDLHPDALFKRLALFEVPRRLRAALAAPSPSAETFAAAEAWLRPAPAEAADAAPVAGAVTAASESAPASAAIAESTQSTLERLLGRPASAAARPSKADAGSALGSMLASAVHPHVTPDVSARRALLLGAIDDELAVQMRALLASPQLRALEGAWRGAERVIRALDTDAELKIGLFDACKHDLVDALGGDAVGGDLDQSELHRLLVDPDQSWSLVAVDFQFDLERADLQLLAALGALAARTGAPLLADATPALVGSPSLAGLADPSTWVAVTDDAAAPFWQALRGSPLGRWIGLALPRVLGRVPYGKKTDPISAFSFEELPLRAGAAPEHRVWTSAAFALAQLFGAAFREEGWQLDPDSQLDLSDLPMHTYDDDGEPQLVPCGEVALGARAATAVGACGITPLLAHHDRAAVRSTGTTSIADPRGPLAGPWSSGDGA
jgi:type VI secretion system protein ImpC